MQHRTELSIHGDASCVLPDTIAEIVEMNGIALCLALDAVIGQICERKKPPQARRRAPNPPALRVTGEVWVTRQSAASPPQMGQFQRVNSNRRI